MIKLKKKRIYHVIGIIIFLAVMVMINMNYRISIIRGNSMYPTVKDNEKVLIQKNKTPQRYDMIAFKQEEKLLIKRIIGLPGDSFTRNGDRVWIDSSDSTFDFLFVITLSEEFAETLPLSGTIPENHYFVVGDALTNSRDSRTFGYIISEDLLGVVLNIF